MSSLKVKFTKKQWEFLKAFYDRIILEILFWGWWRSWKTWGIAQLIIMTCVSLPWIVWLVWRKEWEDLRKSTLVTIQKVLRKFWMVKWEHYELNLQTKELTFWNWSRIFFIPLKQQPADPDFDFLWWYEWTYSFVDEAQEVTRKAIDVLKTRLTEKIFEYDLVPKIIMGCNPRKGHLYNDFIKPQREWKISPDRIFIPALYTDNPYIDHQKYYDQYKNADRITRERILNWNWDYDDRPYKLFSYDAITDLFTNPSNRGKKYIIWDVTGEGKDRWPIAVFDWWTIIDSYVFEKCWPVEYQNKVKEFSQRYWIPMSQTLLDQDWIWWGVVGNLKCKWFQNGSSAIDNRNEADIEKSWWKPWFQNLKTQCYFILQTIIESWVMNIDNLSRYKDIIIQELDAYEEIDVDKEWPRKITPKEDIKEMIWHSPDFADLLAMRCWFEIVPKKRTVSVW